VKQVYKELARLSEEDLRKKYDFLKMAEMGIYPYNWSKDERDLEYLLSFWLLLAAYYKEAAEKGRGMLIDIE